MKYLTTFLILCIISLSQSVIEITLSSTMTDVTEDTYKISSNIVTLISDGSEYKLTGSCSECQIAIKKEISATVTLNSITIDNSNTGPFVLKKNSTVNLILEGTSTITDKETNETSEDYEGAGIKFKSGSSLTISGSGILNIIGKAKNGIKGAAESNLIINSGTFNINATNNGIAADNSVTINDGTFLIYTTEGDGIKSDPDEDDSVSKGNIIINDGTFNLYTYNDGIQAKSNISISGGTFNIKTYTDGSSSQGFDEDNESAKGIKCSNNVTTDIALTISGGNFYINSIDDGLHSDGNLSITGGTFEISSGDDGVHADQYLNLGKLNDDNSKINLKVTKSYEGLEGAYIYIYSGTYNIIASDDGINSAGDSTDTTNEGFQPGQNGPPSFVRNLRGKIIKNKNVRKLQSTGNSGYNMYIYGGEIYVNAEADGLDSNGIIQITGGNITVWGAKTGTDGDPVDVDGSFTISGATFFAGGTNSMTKLEQKASNSQSYIYSSSSISSGDTLNILDGSNIIRSMTVPKNVNYVYYTSPSVDSSTYSFSTKSGSSSTSSNSGNSGSNSSDDDEIITYTSMSLCIKFNFIFLSLLALF